MVTSNMRADELATLKLRRLYESRGFQRVRPGKFEDHGLYIENKNFLQSENVISFMDMDGRLMALKPDVTLSVVKNIPAGPLPTFRKLYYVDEVYRVSREHREYRSHSQIGVELIGPPDRFADIEVMDLALQSLAAIGDTANYVLDVSHIGFLSGLLDTLGVAHSTGKRILGAIHDKSVHGMGAVLEQGGISGEARDRVLALTSLHGGIDAALTEAEGLIASDEMRAAWEELRTVAEALGYNGFGGRINLDFSVVNDLDYYNGLIFQGYVEGLPAGILTGGRYDNLMTKMGKDSGAVGFAISLDDLNTYIRDRRQYDFDLVIVYGGGSNWRVLLQKVKELTAQGLRVRLERDDADLARADFTWKRRMRLDGQELVEEVGTC